MLVGWCLLVLLQATVHSARLPPGYFPNIVNDFDLNDYHSHNQISATNQTAPIDVFIDAGFHAREWVSISTALHLIHNFSRSTDYPPNVNIFIVPLANPDGYEYSRTVNRDWRNTRSSLSPTFSRCKGVDPNRNFPFHWAGQGTSNDPCSDIYRGPRPLSEPETKAVAQFLSRRTGSLKAYVSLHSYHNAILVPYGFRPNARPRDYHQLMGTALEMTRAMNELYGNNYTAINSAELYPAAGCSDDYAKSIGIKYVYTMELTTGDFQGQYVGFETPRELIQQTFEEVRAALAHLLAKVALEPEQSR